RARRLRRHLRRSDRGSWRIEQHRPCVLPRRFPSPRVSRRRPARWRRPDREFRPESAAALLRTWATAPPALRRPRTRLPPPTPYASTLVTVPSAWTRQNFVPLK